MKIGLFADSYLPYVSGVVRSIETFSKELKKLGHQVYIFAPDYPGVASEANIYRFPSIRSLAHDNFYLAIPFSPGLNKYLEQNPLDIVHVHSPFILGRVGAKLARKLKVPLVFTYHTLYDQYTHYVPICRGISKDITKKWCTEFSNRCDLVITPTQIIGKHIESMGVKTKISWLPTGINIEEFQNQDKTWLRRVYNIEPEDTILLFVGRMGKEKNIYFLINCLQRLINESNIGFRLVLVGTGPETENLKDYCIKKALANRVIFTGPLSREDLVKTFCGADLFVFSSLTETQGIVIAEAKAAGLPTVAVNAFGVANMVCHQDDGLLVPHEEEAFVKGILEIIEKPLLQRQMGKRARINANDISAGSCARKLEGLYQELILNNNLLNGEKRNINIL
ncbi:glycosyltransferase family 4 protein [Desulforamulus aquiferis]|uniref:Glycosyltransferase family 4 protein n=1 Tax=Desulforamulus aquiferis TaxID=1397668 RepID=A0AAW7Z9T3_9FIRM|nr:glycosyltransferase family 4 protein [Desulforamulus aquiferis]MDO7786082.1 glycosyltransferase family 4 protein [Desulforamulus aquiferis]